MRSSIDAGKPLRLLLLCSDGPNQRYLRYRLDQAFPGYHCILEPSGGQVRQLMQKRRIVDACYMKYHSLRRRISEHAQQRKAYFNHLVPQDHVSPTPDLTVDSLNCREVWEAVEQWQPELTIVSGTKFIGRKLNERGGLMINLHIGHLPEYKGNHCIFLLYGGDVLDKVFPTVLPVDTEETLYTRCAHMAIDRCIERVEQFSWGEKLEFVPQEKKGRTFRHRDRGPGKELLLWWKIRVGGLLRDYQTAGKPLEGKLSE